METVNQKNKNIEQQNVLVLWEKKAFYKGTYKGVTGVGKTRIGVIACGEDIRTSPKSKKRWLIITPTENLRDNEWVNEFFDWGYAKELKSSVVLECIQRAYKREKETWDGLIIDEVHMSLGPQYRNLLENNTFKKILCLTATIEDEENLAFLSKYAPIFYETGLEEAKLLNMVSDFKIFNLCVNATEEEKRKYIEANNSYKRYITTFSGDDSSGQSFDTAMKCLNPNFAKRWAGFIKGDANTVRTHSFKVMDAVRNRKLICYNSENKIKEVKRITDRFPDRKTIVFSESIIFANKITETLNGICLSYHSKVPKLSKISALERFSLPGGSIRAISAVKALNVGFNVPDCSLGINTSGNSKSIDFFQRLGRTLRYQEDKVSIFIQLYLKIEGIKTQDEKWVEKRTVSNKDVKWISSLEEVNENKY